MSENIRGITFAEQAVTPADDAIVRRAILGDGILTGCDISYSGSTLTMAPGYIIACGRAFQITAAQNWAVVDATSGFARLLVTLDLTKTATEETFGQIEFSLEYAAAEDGFLALVQEDINLSGAKYQIVAAVVSLGTGGITGIVSRLERAESGGGLNFTVVAGLNQPVAATENTIWVKTEKMTGWIFDANQPENLEDGMVWISIGTKSTAKFNALKKNGIWVYIRNAMQQTNGALVNVPAQIYQNERWVDFWEGHLYNAGDEFVRITGGWEAWSSEVKVTKNEDHISLYCTVDPGKTHGYVCGIKNAIDLTDVKEIRFRAWGPASSYTSMYGLGVYKTKDYTDKIAFKSCAGSAEVAVLTLDVDWVQEKCYVGITSGTENPAAATKLFECQLVYR